MTSASGTSRTVYSGRVTNWAYVGALAIGAVVVIALARLWGDSPTGEIVGLAVVFLSMTSVRTTAGPRGVVVRCGLFGLPRYRYTADSIERADVVDLPASRTGLGFSNWRQASWRGHLYICPGPSLKLHLTDGRSIVISTPDPRSAASVVNTYARSAT